MSLLDSEDHFTSIDHDEKIVNSFLRNNYVFCGKYELNWDEHENIFVVHSFGNINTKNMEMSSLTNGLFRFDVVNGFFSCHHCTKLESLEGAPKYVCGDFYPLYFACQKSPPPS